MPHLSPMKWFFALLLFSLLLTSHASLLWWQTPLLFPPYLSTPLSKTPKWLWS